MALPILTHPELPTSTHDKYRFYGMAKDEQRTYLSKALINPYAKTRRGPLHCSQCLTAYSTHVVMTYLIRAH